MKPSTDREAISLILRGLVDAGHTLKFVVDDTYNPADSVPVQDAEAAVNLVCGVDEAYVYFTTPAGERAWIYFVLGNDPEEVACNYTTNLDPDLSAIIDPWWV